MTDCDHKYFCDQPSITDRASGNDDCGRVVGELMMETLREFAPLGSGRCGDHGEVIALVLHNGERLCYECGRTVT